MTHLRRPHCTPPCLAAGTFSSCPSDRHCIGLAVVRTTADPTAIAFLRPNNIHPAIFEHYQLNL